MENRPSRAAKHRCSGQTLSEYVFIVALVFLAAFLILTHLGASLKSKYVNISEQLPQ